ncbi:uncharacterized protein LOC124807584 [Hydra vulgaris]|uniref:uncharacterized protein LOC124807584 n=1 Tax=Hydra vulgaris TaxID=6087 RepID=UPI001F5EFB18|nr:uncharacterized protein LOC124807584 [Hydra vulgaris]
MAGIYVGAQALILQKNLLALYIHCGAHSLNLAGVHAVESCAKMKTFFGPLGFETEFLTKRKKRAKRYHDELANAAFCYESPEHQFEVNIFNVALDHFNYQVHSRFDIVKNVSSRFSFIWLKDQEPDSQEIKARELAQFYANDVKEDDFIQEILYLNLSVAEGERSFCKLKLIKNYCRATMGQERLSDLMMLSVENELAKTLSYDDIITKFAGKTQEKSVL